jgi:NAD+ kinase
MIPRFNVIGVRGQLKKPVVTTTLTTLISFLKSLKKEIIIDSALASSLNDSSLPTLPAHELHSKVDLIIVVGGDGSLLHAAHAAGSTPVLGINRGRLGFLTDIHPTDLDKIKAILNGEYLLEKRFLLSAQVSLHDNIIGEGAALNEVALIPDTVPHISEFEIYIDDQFVCSQNSDGFIITTPTGSTAYALSGGGPILHPELNAIAIVPMFPHSLTMRPIVIDGNRRITIVITPNNSTSPRLSCDSQAAISTPPGSHIVIQKKEQHLHLIHPMDYDYYAALRGKLHWGQKLHYTE